MGYCHKSATSPKTGCHNKKKGQPHKRLTCKFLVAGAGFEPTTSGL